LKPRYFIVENVRGLLSAALQHRPQELRGRGHPKLKQSEMPGSALKLVLNKIRAAGYGVSYNLYNAANFGVPQIRERIIMVCSRDGSEAPFLEPTHSESEEHG
jgi:DNA (cytosine-5)-methyltransferase 1